MPADPTMPALTAHHGDAAKPYYGYCRHSLDTLVGRDDPRCPADCRHKAPAAVVTQFDKLFLWHGAAKAAKWALEQRGGKS